MILLMVLLYAVRKRYLVSGIRGWLAGLYFILVELFAYSLKTADPQMGNFLHAVSLVSYGIAGVLFIYSATGEYRGGRKRLIYILPNTATVLAVLACYGFGYKSATLYFGLAVAGFIVGAASVLAVRLTMWHMMWHVFLWGPLALAAYQGQFRVMAYGMLFYLYASAGYAFYETLPRYSLGRIVMVVGFFSWALIFLVHPAVSNGPYDPFFRQAWNMQKFIIIIGMMVVLMEQQVSTKQWLAFHDELTGLPNRRLFDDRLTQALQRTDRYGGQTALLIIDLNDFKLVNDRFGHQAGDELLSKIALRLQNVLRQTDTVARIGGDEFGVIATGIANESQVRHVVAKVTRAMRTPVVLTQYGEIEASGAIGIALYPNDTTSGTELQALADSRMYAHKRGRSFSQRVVNF